MSKGGRGKREFNYDDYVLSNEYEFGNAIVAVYRPRHVTEEKRAQVEREVKAALTEMGKEMVAKGLL